VNILLATLVWSNIGVYKFSEDKNQKQIKEYCAGKKRFVGLVRRVQITDYHMQIHLIYVL